MTDEHQKRCLYRLWWPKRNDRCLLAPKQTHSECFRQMYGESLEEYHKRLGEQERRQATVKFYQKAGE